MNHALEHDDKVLIEQFIDGTEVSSGVFLMEINIKLYLLLKL